MEVKFFWGSRWSCRGIGFVRGYSTRNIHYIDLWFCRGFTGRIKMINGLRAWKGLLSLGSK